MEGTTGPWTNSATNLNQIPAESADRPVSRGIIKCSHAFTWIHRRTGVFPSWEIVHFHCVCSWVLPLGRREILDPYRIDLLRDFSGCISPSCTLAIHVMGQERRFTDSNGRRGARK